MIGVRNVRRSQDSQSGARETFARAGPPLSTLGAPLSPPRTSSRLSTASTTANPAADHPPRTSAGAPSLHPSILTGALSSTLASLELLRPSASRLDVESKTSSDELLSVLREMAALIKTTRHDVTSAAFRGSSLPSSSLLLLPSPSLQSPSPQQARHSRRGADDAEKRPTPAVDPATPSPKGSGPETTSKEGTKDDEAREREAVAEERVEAASDAGGGGGGGGVRRPSFPPSPSLPPQSPSKTAAPPKVKPGGVLVAKGPPTVKGPPAIAAGAARSASPSKRGAESPLGTAAKGSGDDGEAREGPGKSDEPPPLGPLPSMNSKNKDSSESSQNSDAEKVAALMSSPSTSEKSTPPALSQSPVSALTLGSSSAPFAQKTQAEKKADYDLKKMEKDNKEREEGREEMTETFRHRRGMSPTNATAHRQLNNSVNKQIRQEAILDIAAQAAEHRREMAIEAFKLIDVNGDGYLQKNEVLGALKIMNANGVSMIPATMEAVEKMMGDVDADGDGQIDIDEFITMMSTQDSDLSIDPLTGRMSVLARNVLLAHQRNRETTQIGNDLLLIHPQNWKHAAWDLIMSALIVITVVTMPLTLAWEEVGTSLQMLNFTVDILFMCDVLKNFFTGYIDENESVVMDRKMVAKNYILGYFFIDISSSIPIDQIIGGFEAQVELSYNATFHNATHNGEGTDATSVSRATKTLKVLKLLRMAKLFRLLRLSRAFRFLKMGLTYAEEVFHMRISDGVIKFVRLTVSLVLVCHWIGSLNFMFCRMSDFPEDSWVVHADLQDASVITQWTWCFFKALAQMLLIGFQSPPFTNVSCDVRTPWCETENWITLTCLYIGAIFYSLLISSIGSIMSSANMSSRHFDETIGKLDDYMRSQKLPAPMREKVKDYFHLQHTDGKLFDENKILKHVTPILKREIISYKNREILIKVPLLQVTDENELFSSEVSCILKPLILFADEIAARESTTGRDIYFIFSGVIEIFLTAAADLTYVAIGDGCYFGEVSMLLGCKRTASARSKTQCVLFVAEATTMKRVLEDFPAKRDYMVRVARARQSRIISYLSDTAIPDNLEADEEDAKTDMFGTDADEMMVTKDLESEKHRHRARISVRATHNTSSGYHDRK